MTMLISYKPLLDPAFSPCSFPSTDAEVHYVCGTPHAVGVAAQDLHRISCDLLRLDNTLADTERVMITVSLSPTPNSV